MKNIWLMEDAEVDRLVAIMHEHAELALESAVGNVSKERRIEIIERVDELRRERVSLIGR